MGLEFKQKRQADQREIENITTTLFEFVINNKKYLDMTFAIISTYTEETDGMEYRVLFHPMIDDLEGDEKLNKYIGIVERFYQIHESDKKGDLIAYRRGDLLELLSSHISPLKKSEDYDIIRESLVYENGSRVGDKDIDVITEYKDSKNIECIECKANIGNYIGKPMDDDCISKLDFMVLVSNRAEIYNIKARLLFATYREDIEYSLDILKENGYNTFEVMRGSEIKRRLVSR